MSSNPGAAGGGRRPRSAEQRQGSAAMAQVMQAWEQLSDMELLTLAINKSDLQDTRATGGLPASVRTGRQAASGTLLG